MEADMFLEQILEEIAVTNKRLSARVEELEKVMNEKISGPTADFMTIKQMVTTGQWPYSEQATRKMIERGKFEENYHYNKIDSKYICNWKAMQEYLENKFYTRRSA